MKIIRLLKHELSSDAAGWVDRGIVSEEQASSILALYGAELPTGQRQARGHYVLMALAALFVGLSAILFISGNWENIPREVRMISLIALTLFCHVIGIRMSIRDRVDPARIWFFLGSLLYGASIFLIAQIYHLGEHFPNGVFYWALGVLPFALLSRSVLLMLLASVLSQIWLLIEGSYGYFPTAFPLFACAGLWFCLEQRKSIIIFLFSVVGLITYGEFLLGRIVGESEYAFSLGAEHIYFTTGIFLLLYYLGCWLEKTSERCDLLEYGLSLRIWCLRFGLLTLFILSFEESWKDLLRNSIEAKTFIGLWLAIMVVVPVWSTLGLKFDQTKLQMQTLLPRIKEYSSTFIFLGVYVLLNVLVLASSSDNRYLLGSVLAIVTNLVLLGMGVWFLCKAFATESSGYFYLGLTVILFTALLRYFDLIGDYLGGSILFLVAAGIMFGSAMGWRRYVVKRGGAA